MSETTLASVEASPQNRTHALYTAEERARRDSSIWTKVQGVLAPLQFAVFLISLGLVLWYMQTGTGYWVATGSIILKTFLLYTIMITGAIWEKIVFDQYLFAGPFFWEDVFSFLVIGLHSFYLIAFFLDWSAASQMWIALIAYGAYVINAFQFLWKLRRARLEGGV